MSRADVGRLREQSALSPADTQVVVVSKDPDIANLLKHWRVVAVYPDTTDAEGRWVQGKGTFKIELARAPLESAEEATTLVRDLKEELLEQQRAIEAMIQQLKRRREGRPSMELQP
jgi:hypothetical protein